ncbi:GNAT family N-acetyltransferase [Paucisalibacillus sp. EB02]|uniref:GNAT family N-acetyltransferase n=1 Tax=Paucisalibacillus sp. EB02 TaxID=1347087 RepID=UPI0004AEE403|nr:GNAT family N-acetyltransferase [Paucisalibacillus sp. EB02]
MFKTNNLEGFIVRKAIREDLGSVLDLLKSAAKWVQDKGIDQWGYLLEGGEDHEIEADILAGNTYIMENENKEMVATFNFSNEQNEWDVDMWGKRNDNAFYIHRLAVSQLHHNKQIGKRLLAWMDENHTIENGFIRLDCVGNNEALNKFYLDAGFRFMGHIGEGNDKFSLYEKAFLR